MRKFLRLTLVCLMAMVSTLAFADTYSFTFDKDNKFSGSGTEILNGVAWTLETDASHFQMEGGDNSRGLQIGSKNTPATSLVLSTSGITGTITSVKINTCGASGINATIDATVSGNAFGEQYTLTETSSTDVTFTGSASGEIKLTYTNSAKAAIYIKSVEVTYDGTIVSKKDPKLAFSETSVSVVLGDDVFTAPTLTKETSADPVYSSSDKDVATVDAATGDVTIVGVGTTTITATTEENDEYSAGSASYTLTVTAPALTEVTLPYYESFKDGIGSFTIDDVELSEGLSYVWKHDDYGYMKASAFVSNSNKASESWLVSPTINLEDVNTATLKFTQTINFFNNVEEEATLWIKEEGGEWNQVTITYPTGEGWVSNDQTIDLKDYAGKKIQVGFKYVSTTESAGTWEIEDFSVTSVNTGDEVVTLPYEESFENGIGLFTIDDVKLSEGLSYVWKHDAESGYMKASAFVSNSNKASESWLVSPFIDLTNASEATLKFTQTINFFSKVEEEATLWIKEEGGEWKQVTITYPTGSGWVSNDQTIDLKDYVGKKIKVGFKYVSTTESAGTWEIEDFSVTGTTTGIDNITVDELDENAPIYNLAGQRVSKDAKGIVIQNGKKYIRK